MGQNLENLLESVLLQSCLLRAKNLLGAGGVAVRADVTKMEELDALYQRVRGEFEHIDVLFANAGMPGASPSRR
ncbi:MAG: SDR family NAD(P)-dependent oxidoreductase [Acidobacteria bacterium]|nr:SDR family NAD(P)-dependent oxidoreductase [Acidobacteriota bacterium]